MDDQEIWRRSTEDTHNDQIERYGKARSKALRVSRYLATYLHLYSKKDQIRLAKQREKLKYCGNTLIYGHYYTIDKFRLVEAYFCGNKWLDPLCGLRWASKMVSEYIGKHEQIMAENPSLKVCMLTLTVRNGERLGATFKKLEDGLRRMSYAMRNAKSKGYKSEFGKIKGMLGAIEVQKTVKGKWHPHFHAIVLLEDYIDQAKLSEEWKKKTGDSFITHIQEVGGGIDTFCEVISYSLKFSTMKPSDTVEAYLKLSGKQCLRSYGLYQGVKEPEKLTDEPIDNLPYTRIVYRYIYKSETYTVTEVETGKVQMKRDFEDPRLRQVQNRNAAKGKGAMLPEWQVDEDQISPIMQAPF